MKLVLPKHSFKTILSAAVLAGMLVAQPASAIGKPFKSFSVASGTEEDKPAKKSKTKAKTKFASLNNVAVKIYPDVIKRDMHVVAKGNDGKEIDFFVFDVEGALVQHYKMKAKDHNKLS